MEIHVVGDPLEEAVKQMEEAARHEASYAALMADHHIGYSVPVGGVIAYESKICVNGVGFDIACGNKAVLLDCPAEGVKNNIYRSMNEIQKHISFGVGRRNDERVDHELFDDPLWDAIPLLRGLKQKAMAQLGTVGSGNHYVDVFTDELNRVWIGVHFGSRGLGHSICTHFIKEGGGKDGVHATPVIFSETSDLGEQYIKCMELAGRYAYAGRDWVCSRVAKILRGNIIEEVHNHHNFAWKERHFDRDLWVKRDLSEALWETFQSYWKANYPQTHKHSYTQQFMEQAVRWEECKQRVKEIAVVISPEQEWSNKTNMMLGLKRKESKLEGVTLTNLPMPTSVLNKFSRRMLLQ